MSRGGSASGSGSGSEAGLSGSEYGQLESDDNDRLSATRLVCTAASPGATTHGPAAEALLEGAECNAETECAVGPLDAAAAAETRPPGPVDWAAAGAAGAAKDGQMGNASAEVAMTAAGEAAATGAKAAAEAESVTDGAPSGQRPKPANWGDFTKARRDSWKKHSDIRQRGRGGDAKGPSPRVLTPFP